VHRIARFERRERRLEFRQESIGDSLGDDEPLGRTAGLPVVVHPSPDSPRDRVLEIGIIEDDECVAPTELHGGDLEILTGPGRDALAGGDAASQCDALDPGVVDDARRLIMRDEEIRVQASRSAGIGPELLERDRALRHDASVLHQQSVAGHQVRTGDRASW
jgi:hypothetical protein